MGRTTNILWSYLIGCYSFLFLTFNMWYYVALLPKHWRMLENDALDSWIYLLILPYFTISKEIWASRYLQFSSVAQSCPTLCNPMNRSTPGLPVHHHLPELTQTHVHRVGDAIQPSHPLSPPSPPAPNRSQHQSLFQWVNSSHDRAKVLEFQL